ncbi:MAG: chemotaxis protein CheW [Myxococcales bacterium]
MNADAGPWLNVLLCQAGSLACAVPVLHVAETMRPLRIESLRGVPPFVSGMSIVRGVSVPVIDLAQLLGNETGAKKSRFVLVKVGTRSVALAVDGVIGVRRLESATMSALPPLLRGASAEFVSAIGLLDDQLLVVLESGTIVPDAVWTRVSSGGQA